MAPVIFALHQANVERFSLVDGAVKFRQYKHRKLVLVEIWTPPSHHANTTNERIVFL